MSAYSRAADVASLCVRRPTLAAVMSLMIVLAGLAALFGVSVRELPDVDRPVVTVTTEFPGATPAAIDAQVTRLVEGAVARVPGLVSVSSSSARGRSRIVAEFGEGVDLDIAANDMRDAVSGIVGRLPEDAAEPRVVKADADGDAILRLAVVSDRHAIEELSALAERLVFDRLAAVEGVADVQVYGLREPVFRVTLDVAALNARGLTIADVRRALDGVLSDAPAGDLRMPSSTVLVEAGAAARSVDEIEATFVDRGTRIRDVASVSLGPAEDEMVLRSDGRVGLGAGILRQASSNTIAISSAVRATVDELNRSLPDGIEVAVRSDDAVFVGSAVAEVLRTLVIATLLVVVIILLFFRSWRATLIPTVTVPIAIVGTLAAIYMMGFSVNVLTLLALVLATGIVVDDAIVVIENIERRRAEGMGARAAAVLGTRQVFFAVVATTLTLAAVFIPISFLPGQAGRLFAEFGFTLAAAVLLSSFVALTLAPMLASRLLKDEAPRADGAPRRRLDPLGTVGGWFVALYRVFLVRALALPLVVLTVCALFGVAAWIAWSSLPEELTPPEDRGFVLLVVSAPQGASLAYTDGKVAEIEAILEPYVEAGEIESVLAVIGTWGRSNRAFIAAPLVDWAERERGQQAIVSEINGRLGAVVGVSARAISPNSLGIRGGGQGLRIAVLGEDYDAITDTGLALVGALRRELPALTNPSLSIDVSQPQLSIRLDTARAADLGVDPADVALALQTALDGRRVGDVFVGDRAVEVRLRTPEGAVSQPDDLAQILLRGNGGALVPLSALASLTEESVSPSLERERQRRSVTVEAGLPADLPLRAAIEQVRAVATPLLAPGQTIAFLGEAAALEETSRGVAITFAFALAIVLLVLAAQFESVASGVVIMLVVPFGLGAAALAMAATGTSLNIYSQIGLVMLIGLMAKNGILIVEFANQLRDEGMSVRDAALEAAVVRFRPVMMTLISTVLGGLPLVLSSGAGAEARAALGWVVVGGLGLSVLFTLFLTPVAYLLLARFAKPRAAEAARLDAELAAAERAEERAAARGDGAVRIPAE
ncbi:efflux RND transporter permease subunit [Salinarimonas chemoclinalis]|uniref:efflux RND transporter permease subunit n=1 Tax=Salinarimonas chemoclinalis TaxID=3241599 RepID=UPI003558C6C0